MDHHTSLDQALHAVGQRTWITETQDRSPAMAQALDAVTAHVRAASR